jgi:hypothetical protein
MSLRYGAWFAIALVPACTGSNPAFDRDTGAAGDTADDDDDDDGESSEASGTSTGSESTSSPDSADTTDTEPSGAECSHAAPLAIGTATSLDARECPSESVVRGTISAMSPGSFDVVDCGDCSFCSREAPTWTFTLPEPLVPAELRVGDCLDVHYDCDGGDFTELRNVALMQGPSAPLLVIAAPALPESLGAWSPFVEGGAGCPTVACPENSEITLQFLDVGFNERETGRAHIFVDDDEIELDVSVGNAHYDPMKCEEVIVWVGKG